MIPTNFWALETALLESLMPVKVNHILLIASLYDSFVFEVDGFLAEQVTEDFRLLNLSTQPEIFHASSLESALKMLELEQIEIIIIHLASMRGIALNLLELIKQDFPEMPVYFLLGAPQDLMFIENHTDKLSAVEDFFYWNGDSKLFLAIIKLWEETVNIPFDTEIYDVPIIMVVETFIPYYSQFLPILYEQIMQLCIGLIRNEHQSLSKNLYLNARPRIVLLHDFKSAVRFYNQYKNSIIGTISNINYHYLGESHPNGGLELLQFIRKQNPNLPFLMQSFNPMYRDIVSSNEGEFLYKDLPGLSLQIRRWLQTETGFGKFIFREPNSKKLGEASSLIGFHRMLAEIPVSSLEFHLKNRHIYNWLATHAEAALCLFLKNIPNTIDLIETKSLLDEAVTSLIAYRRREKIQDFGDESDFDLNLIYKIGDDSIGGKGRGLAFLNVVLNRFSYVAERYPEVKISVPVAAVLATGIFDEFISFNPQISNPDLLEDITDEEIDRLFLSAQLPQRSISALSSLLSKCSAPLAVRSSSVLEDHITNPFAGVFRTFLIPNSHADSRVRLGQLIQAVKLVYSSMYLKNARAYREALNIPAREEKMAVIIQKVAGSKRGDSFYPMLSGVAQSYNYYPAVNMSHEDGIVTLSTGLGKTAVERERTFAFCPTHPKLDMFPSVDIVKGAQRHFYALNLALREFTLFEGEDSTLIRTRVTQQLLENELISLSSVWDHENKEFISGKYTKGPRVITYRNILHYQETPLAQILRDFLNLGREVLGCEVEMEFAFDVDPKTGEQSFHLLQIRPISVNKHLYSEDLKNWLTRKDELVLFSSYALGSSTEENLDTIVYLPPERFDIVKTEAMAVELEEINQFLKPSKYLLIVPGRW
ncbi:MAG: PEP/pyruvate-binding domain-containing protein, partial [Candidatus Cloacimonetes bacterium]|nr:PEP/pyruvate-binding domain-containing protein [Candidatus Cloacimonadota bacterium]